MKRYLLSGFLVAIAGLPVLLPRNQGDDFRFEVTSLKALNEAESKRIGGTDFIGADVLVRLRLSAVNRDLFFYGYKHLKTPAGFRIKWRGEEKIWLAPDAGIHGARKSPGIGGLRLSVEWFKLEKRKTVEWELMDGTGSAGEQHGESTFIKFSPDEKPIEIFSDPYLVPSPVTSKR